MAKYSHLFRGLDIEQETLTTLDARVSKTIDNKIENAIKPFEYVKKYEAWFLASSQEINFPLFPKGGYDSEAQAEIALGLYKAKPNGAARDFGVWENTKNYTIYLNLFGKD